MKCTIKESLYHKLQVAIKPLYIKFIIDMVPQIDMPKNLNLIRSKQLLIGLASKQKQK